MRMAARHHAASESEVCGTSLACKAAGKCSASEPLDIAHMDIPGKSCGACSMCCQVLEIEELQKPAGLVCKDCMNGGGCRIYAARPKVCREYECEWKGNRSMGPQLRPERVGTILMEDADSDEYQAVCDPTKPLAWRTPIVFNHLVAMAKAGRTVVAKAGAKSWRIHASGEWGPCS